MTESINAVEDFTLFAEILRNSGYRSVSYGAAEIIDNSIDGKASNVLIILESTETKIKNIGFLDNGIGMSAETLWKAVTIGGRFEDISKSKEGRRGKYGFGLPGASAAYNEKLEVYTWGKQTNGKVFKVILDLGALSKGIQKPIEANLPEPYFNFKTKKAALKAENKFIFKDIDFESQGTLVLWCGCQRVKPVTTKLLADRYLFQDLGRIFRHFITDDPFSRKKWNKCDIYLAHGFEAGKKIFAAKITPNDPMHIMPDHIYKSEGIDFVPKIEFNSEFELRGSKVNVRFSLVSRDIFVKFSGKSRKTMKKNTGISIVREGREIDLSDFNYIDPQEQRNRWWGCEIFFDKPCDDFFRVPANKQYVEGLKQYLEDEEGEEYPQGGDITEWPIWITLERKFNLKSILSSFLKEIKSYRASLTPSGETDKTIGDDNIGDTGGGIDLPVDPNDNGEDSISGDNKNNDEAINNAKMELKKIGVDKPSKEQIERFVNHSVVMSYLHLGDQAGFISIALDYGVCHLKINLDSKFYQYVLVELRNRNDHDLVDVYRGIELMLLAYARCMDLRRNYESSKEFPRVLRAWSNKVEELIETTFEDN